MKTLSFCIAILLFNSSLLYSQVAVNEDGSAPDASAAVDIAYTNKGLLPPRMTSSQRTGITSPAAGLLVFQTDAPSGYYYYTGSNWVGLITGTGAGATSTCIDYDGNAYPTCIIGTQVWMAENLRVTHYRNGEVIQNVTDTSAWVALDTSAYCWYENDKYLYEALGALYNWFAVNDSRSICPEGWHVPSADEWGILIFYLGGENVAGGKMKSVTPMWTDDLDIVTTNSSGFSGLPGGYRGSDTGGFCCVRTWGNWWSSTVDKDWPPMVDYCFVISSAGVIILSPTVKTVGCSVRCLRDV